MHGVGSDTAAGLVDPLFELKEDSDEVAHLVCCRDISWRRAFCGEPGEHLMTSASFVCTMCIEIADGLLPGWRSGEPLLCPIDGRQCPDEEQVDADIERRSFQTD